MTALCLKTFAERRRTKSALSTLLVLVVVAVGVGTGGAVGDDLGLLPCPARVPLSDTFRTSCFRRHRPKIDVIAAHVGVSTSATGRELLSFRAVGFIA
jgi:hypothetical protein